MFKALSSPRSTSKIYKEKVERLEGVLVATTLKSARWRKLVRFSLHGMVGLEWHLHMRVNV
eukprot:4871534-Amphidinium_carterae.1